MRSRNLSVAMATVAALLLGGCSVVNLKQDLDQRERLALLSGEVGGVPAEHDAEIRVALFHATASGQTLADLSSLPHSFRRYAFALRGGERYQVAAFLDTSGDGAYQPGEPAGTLGDAGVQLAAGEQRVDATLTLSAATRLPDGWSWTADGTAPAARLPIVAGEVTTLDDPRFTAEEASSGMWQPMESSLRRGAGVFFLEPYDPQRTPVLFVHGIGGSPSDFRAMIGELDRTRFQAWVYVYPSGVPLQRASRVLAGLVSSLAREHQVRRLAVTAHSMGGLVARAALLELASRGEAGLVQSFTTFSTPYGGHAAAAHGVKYSPVVVPSWVDMQPESEFLQALRKPLPAEIPFTLFFGYDTGRSMIWKLSHDTVIPVWSQIPSWVQDEADHLWGINADHTAILAAPDALQRWRAALAAAADADRTTPAASSGGGR